MLAERLRWGSQEARAALARAGRYQRAAGNLGSKKCAWGTAPARRASSFATTAEAAARDREVRGNLVAYPSEPHRGLQRLAARKP